MAPNPSNRKDARTDAIKADIEVPVNSHITNCILSSLSHKHKVTQSFSIQTILKKWKMYASELPAFKGDFWKVAAIAATTDPQAHTHNHQGGGIAIEEGGDHRPPIIYDHISS